MHYYAGAFYHGSTSRIHVFESSVDRDSYIHRGGDEYAFRAHPFQEGLMTLSEESAKGLVPKTIILHPNASNGVFSVSIPEWVIARIEKADYPVRALIGSPVDDHEEPDDELGHVKVFYLSAYPSDTCGFEINETLTFRDVLTAISHKRDVYETLGIEDSIVRERVFEELSKRLGKDYEDIYQLWLHGDPALTAA